MSWLRWGRRMSERRAARPNRFVRPLCAEPLESRHLMAITVFLDFGAASGDNSFADRLQELASIDGRIPFTGTEISNLKSSIAAAVQTAFTGYDISFTQSLPAGDFETLSFGRTKDFVVSAPENFGHAELDWLNINHFTNPGEATAYVFPVEFTKGSLANPIASAYLNRLG